jgi:hypothetical protein
MSMFKYKILIKLFVLNCVLICFLYGDTIQAAVVVLCLLVSLCCSTVRPADDLCNISFKQRLPEDGHNRWPIHVKGYAVYNKINLYISYELHNFVSQNEIAFFSFRVALSMSSISQTFPNFTADANTFFQVSKNPSSPR